MVDLIDFTATSYDGGGLTCSGNSVGIAVVDLGDSLATLRGTGGVACPV